MQSPLLLLTCDICTTHNSGEIIQILLICAVALLYCLLHSATLLPLLTYGVRGTQQWRTIESLFQTLLFIA
jgi:hypothetical protein